MCCVSVWCVCVLVCVGVCAESVCGCVVLCFGVCGAVCAVVCAWCVCNVWCVCLCVWRGLARGKHPCVARLGTRKNVSVCTFKTLPCVLAKRAHVEHMRAFCLYTRRRFEPTHGDVLNLHTGSLSLSSPSLFLSSFLLFSLPSYFSRSLSLLSSLLSSLSATMTMITRPVGSLSLSLCKHGSDLPECQSAWSVAHSLLGEHVRIMQETTVLA